MDNVKVRLSAPTEFLQDLLSTFKEDQNTAAIIYHTFIGHYGKTEISEGIAQEFLK